MTSEVDENTYFENLLKAAKVQSPKSYLFSTLVKDYLGIGPAIIISKLYSNYKLTLKELVSKTPADLGPKRIKSLLVMLIHLKCVKYSTNDINVDSSIQGNGLCLYYVDEEGLLLLLYSGEIISILRTKYLNDSIIEQIIQNFLSLGNLTLGDYLKNFTNYDPIEIENKFNVLLKDGWITPIKSSIEFQNKYEIYHKLYKRNYNKYPKLASISEIKRKKEVRYQTEVEFNKYFAIDYDNIYENDANSFENIMNGNKSNKVLSHSSKLNTSNLEEFSKNEKIKKDVSFKFSLNRFFKSMRTIHLVKLVCQRLGKVSSLIYQVILEKIEKNSPDCFGFSLDFNEVFLFKTCAIDTTISSSSSSGMSMADSNFIDSAVIATADLPAKSKSQYLHYVKNLLESDKSLCFSLQEIGSLIKGKSISLLDTIIFKSTVNGSKKRKMSEAMYDSPSGKKVKFEVPEGSSLTGDLNELKADNNEEIANGNAVEESEEEEGEDMDKPEDIANPYSLGLVYQHLNLMMQNPQVPFIKQSSNGTYYVPFSYVVPYLKQTNYMYLVKSVLGLNEFKVLNCIIMNKLIDEKTLVNKTLLNENDLRVSINKLFKIQAIEIQEIPKTLDRQATRSLFAYKFNKKSFNNQLISDNLMNEMGRLLENVDILKYDNRLLLSKVNREDVKGKESELLMVNELNQLNWLTEKEMNCIGRIHRARSIWEIFVIF